MLRKIEASGPQSSVGRERGGTMDQTHATETHLEETKPNPRKKILLLCCLVAAILVVAYCAQCGGGGRGTIYPNVTISGVIVVGLSKQEAQTALE